MSAEKSGKSKSAKSAEKVNVKFREAKSSPVDSLLGKQFSSALKSFDNIQKVRAFLLRPKVQKWANIIVAAVSPILVLSLFIPLSAKFISAVGYGFSIPASAVKVVIFYSMPVVTLYSVRVLTKLYGWPEKAILKFNKLSAKKFLITISALTIYIICSGVVFWLAKTLNLIPDNLLQQSQDIGFNKHQSALGLINVFITLAIVAPLVEEMIFRGLGFLNLRRLISFWPAAIYSSLIFAIYHGQLNVGLDTFILGMFMVFAVERTDSLYSSLLMHFIKNSLAFSFLFLVK